jgi:hypothetical protein
MVMPYQIKKMGKKYRIVTPGTNKVAKNSGGTAIDGGGHGSREKASKQVRAIMSKEHGKGRSKKR